MSENKLNMHNTYLKSNIRLLLFIIIVCVATIVNYIFFIRPNTYPHLFSFWGSEFPPRSTIFDIISFYVKSFPNFSGLFIPNQYLNMEIKLAILFVILVGLIRLLNSFVQKEQIHSELFILICLPFLSLIAANIMGKYPYGATKVNFFIFPVFLILFVYGIICFRNLLQWLLGKDFGEIIEYSFQTLCIFTAMIFLYLVFLYQTLNRRRC